MPTKPSGEANLRFQLNLVGYKSGDTRPTVVVTALRRDRWPLHAAAVDADGSFEIPEAFLKEADRIVIGVMAEAGENIEPETALVYRVRDFVDTFGASRVVSVSEQYWRRWFFIFTCVSGSVQRCLPIIWWYWTKWQAMLAPVVESNVRTAKMPIAETRNMSAPAAVLNANLAEVAAQSLIRFPMRCETVCDGVVEVYRRECCHLLFIDDDWLRNLIRELEEILRQQLVMGPLPPFPPNPPDPWLNAARTIDVPFITNGTLDEKILNVKQDLYALRTLPKADLPSYIQARPYLCWWWCGKPQKVAQGFINPQGKFDICFRDTPFLLLDCDYEYAYVVKQMINGQVVTIYDGVSANIWFSASQTPTLTSYSPQAIGCGDDPFPEDGAYALLQDIGGTHSYNLKTPDAAGWDRVQTPAYNDGLAFPAPSPAAALGNYLNCNWGGGLALRYAFGEPLQSVGAKYYRISVCEADANGNPVGTRHALHDPLSWNYNVFISGVLNVESYPLGPNTAGSETNLFEIPFHEGTLGRDWQSGQYHGAIDTTQFGNKPYLVTLEIFDSAGHRLRPTAAPPTGLAGEAPAAFTFRRWYQPIGPTAEVNFAALTHLFWWDNRPVVANLVSVYEDGLEYNEECMFLEGTASSTVALAYRAYHPNVMFQKDHSLGWHRGFHGSSGSFANDPSATPNIGVPPAPPGLSGTQTFAQMLDTNLKCSFTVSLSVQGKMTNGSGFFLPVTDTESFALEIVS